MDMGMNTILVRLTGFTNMIAQIDINCKGLKAKKILNLEADSHTSPHG
jgi:hypothetical protein